MSLSGGVHKEQNYGRVTTFVLTHVYCNHWQCSFAEKNSIFFLTYFYEDVEAIFNFDELKKKKETDTKVTVKKLPVPVVKSTLIS